MSLQSVGLVGVKVGLLIILLKLDVLGFKVGLCRHHHLGAVEPDAPAAKGVGGFHGEQ